MDLAKTLRTLIAGIDSCDIPAAKAAGMTQAADALTASVRDSLSVLPGGSHEYPWLRTGQLRASIGADVDGDRAVVGSASDVGAYQEQGTAKIPPRPYLAPNALLHASEMAETVGRVVQQALADALRVSAR